MTKNFEILTMIFLLAIADKRLAVRPGVWVCSISQSGEIPIEISQKLKTWKRDMSSRSLDFDQFRQFRKETKHPEKPKKRNLVSIKTVRNKKKVNEKKTRNRNPKLSIPLVSRTEPVLFFFFNGKENKPEYSQDWTQCGNEKWNKPKCKCCQFRQVRWPAERPSRCDRRVTMAT
jgi:hypothetical protein